MHQKNPRRPFAAAATVIPIAYRNAACLAATCLAATGLAALCLAPLPAHAKSGPVKVDLELVLAVDISFSMDPEEQRLQRAGYVEALKSPDFLRALKTGINGKIAITYFQWASNYDTNVLLPWTIIDGAASADAAANRLAAAPYRRARRTSISGAIEKAMSLFEKNGYNGVRRVIDISGDGTNNDGGPVSAARDAALRQGVVINGLPLMVRPSTLGFSDISNLDEYYEDCVTGGPGSFVIPIRDRSQFIRATRTKLVMEVASSLPSIQDQFRPADLPVLRVPVSMKRPRVSCLIGEQMWRERWGN
ncbi:MAG: DUF1194 domain-containing protein [Hyphomicrobiales bacterium]|nr:DUF1194 domain-containing protein [Hyphomicrobiales bacterium]